MTLTQAHGSWRIVNSEGTTVERHGSKATAEKRLAVLQATVAASKKRVAEKGASRAAPAVTKASAPVVVADDPDPVADIDRLRLFLTGSVREVVQRIEELSSSVEELSRLRAVEEAVAARPAILDAITKRMDAVEAG